jgi:hypothetical protein
MDKVKGKAVFPLKQIGIIILLPLIIGLAISTTQTVPDHALLYVDDVTKTYIAPPWFIENKKLHYLHLRLVPAKEAHRLKYSPDAKCRDSDGFIQEGRSLTGIFFEYIGLLKPLPSRWNPDGSWNW